MQPGFCTPCITGCGLWKNKSFQHACGKRCGKWGSAAQWGAGKAPPASQARPPPHYARRLSRGQSPHKKAPHEVGSWPRSRPEGLSPLSTSFSTSVLKTLIFPQSTTGYTGGAKARLQTIYRRKYRAAPLLIHIFHRKTGFPPFPGVFPVENS